MNRPRLRPGPPPAQRRRVRLFAATVSVALVAGASAAFAYWASTDSSNANFAVAAAQTLPQGATPSASVAGSAVTVTFPTVRTTSGDPITTYTVTRHDATTGAATPISGACSVSGSTATCADAPGDGAWRYTDAPRVFDWVGGESDRSGPVTVDTVAPAVTLTPVATPSNNPAPAFSGTYGAAAGDVAAVSVTVYAGSGTGGTVQATPAATLDTGDHTWSTAALATALAPDGTYTVAARQTDAAGNTGLATSTFVVDTAAPAAAVPAAAAANSSGTSPLFVDGGAVTFTDGASDAGSGVASVSYYRCPASAPTCTSGGTLIGTSTTPAGGFAVTSAAPLAAEGAYRVVAVATDRAGNTGAPSGALLVTVDTTAPTVSRPIVNGNA